MDLRFKVHIKIQKPVSDVFDAVYNPKKLSSYFTTGGASGPLDEGKTVTWDFADFPGAFPVYVRQVIPNQLIVFEWQAAGSEKDPYNTKVEMHFEPIENNSTMVSITESGWKQDEKGLESSYGNCFGWSHMSCCLKAFVEYGINLRKGSF
ncbi:SRPBCC family protein [bacterium]|nr:SRPBCC family protein [bacterium]MCI0612130.1 SRPBCC family protein [bacterium]